MQRPILTICIPTYNRSTYLQKTLDSIVSSDVFNNTDLVEIVISNNCSSDNTDSICRKYVEKFPNKINYIKQESPIFPDVHIFKTIEYANGVYCKLNNDTLVYNKGALDKIVLEYLNENTAPDCIFFLGQKSKDNSISQVQTFNNFIQKVSFYSTWIGGFCIKKDVYMKLNNPLRYAGLKLPQVDIYGQIFEAKFNVYVIEDELFSILNIDKKGGDYNIAEVFGKNYLTILKEYVDKKLLSPKIFVREKRNVLLKHINKFYFDFYNQFAFQKTGYFRFLLEDYWYEPYFYFAFFLNYIRLFLSLFIKIEKDSVHKKIKLLGFIKIKVRRDAPKSNWAKRNKHNKTSLASSLMSERITVGTATYGIIDAVFSSNGNEKLIIGDYCSIANGVKFLVSSEHLYKGLSTYPFKTFYLGHRLEAVGKGSIVVKDDVWIGTNAMIMSGVTIGQGAIIAAGAIVTKDVPPYAIVGGNPAKVIKYRFEQEIIEKLIKFDYSKLTEEKIKSLGERLYTEITSENVDDLLKEFQS